MVTVHWGACKLCANRMYLDGCLQHKAVVLKRTIVHVNYTQVIAYSMRPVNT